MENKLLQQLLSARTVESVEGSIAYARFLRMSGLDTENYPVFLKMLEIENHWVLDELIGDQDPFLLLSAIPPNKYLVSKAFGLLTRWRPGGIYPKTLAIVLGILQNAFSSPKDGYRIYELGIADVDNLGKHLDREKDANDPQNRCLLDILEKISTLMGLQWNETMEAVARQSMNIRNCFFDNTKMMEDCLPQVLIVRGDYMQNEIAPKMVFKD
ncbi:MAG: hypothetical protein QME74_05515 [Candidatus Edwardsbacteria bacterium]|nr:hypothetical protein [Candidatus Edwardsbacteria bacterium]